MDELETLLRQYRPRRPRPLPEVDLRRGSRPLVWAVWGGIAAAVVMMVGWRQPIQVSGTPKPVVTLGALAPYAIAESRDLDSVLTRTSRAILPDVESSTGVLHVLARE